MSFADAIIVIVVSYYFTGHNMLAFHRIWPIVARSNGELGWFAVTFVSTALVVGVVYGLLGKFVDSTFWRVLIISVASFTPLLAAPFALIAMIVWLAVSKPFGLRIPSGTERLGRR